MNTRLFSLIASLFLSGPILLSAQSDCKLYSEVNEVSGWTVFSPKPGVMLREPVIPRMFFTESGANSVLLSIRGYWGIDNYNAYGVLLKLSDGSTIRDKDVEVSTSFIRTGRYLYSTHLKPSDDELALLVENDITEIHIAGMKQKISERKAQLIRKWLKCIITAENPYK